MLKGINHSVIEVNNTGSEYYERAILIVKPEYSSVQREILEEEAKSMLFEMDAPSVMKIKRRKWKTLLIAILSAVFGALLTALFFM